MTTIDGRYLPPPVARFGGEINLNASQSKPWWPPRVVPPKGAPNVLLIMTDDVGYRRPVTGIPHGDAPSIINRSYSISAEIEVGKDGEGMLNTNGGRFGGYGLYLLKGKPVFTYNFADFVRFRWEGKDALTPGKHTVSFEFTNDGPGFGRGGTGVLKVDGKAVDSKKIPNTLVAIFQWDETFDVGSDTGTPVDDKDYSCPFKFTGTIEKVTIKVGPVDLRAPEKSELKKKLGERD
jgi:arylsulfatase